jgi:uncharacterized protein YjiS (DUF1127 family)
MATVLAFPAAARPPREHPWLLHRWQARWCRRAELRRLLATSPHLLLDIGLTPRAAGAECSKPFWRA